MKKLSILILSLLVITGFVFAQSITVTSPHSGDTWYKGNSYNITWTKTGTMDANVKITLYNTAGTTLIEVMTMSTPNDGSYSWTIPGSVATVNYIVRVKTTDNLYFDNSDIFSITDPPGPAASITVNSPNGGENLISGISFEIKWNSTNVSHNIGIILMKGSVFEGTAYIGPNTGSYNWKFDKFLDNSPVEAGIYKIRVRSIDDYSVYNDTGEFTIKKLSFSSLRNLTILNKKFYRPVLPTISKVDLTITGIAKTNSTGGRYITYTVKNLNYNIVKLSTPVWFKAWDINNSSNKKEFGLFQWQSALDNFNSSGEYTANVSIQEGWSPNIKIKIDPFSHINESNESNNEAEINFQ